MRYNVRTKLMNHDSRFLTMSTLVVPGGLGGWGVETRSGVFIGLNGIRSAKLLHLSGYTVKEGYMRSKLNEITHHGSPNHATSNVVRGQAWLNARWTGRSCEPSEKNGWEEGGARRQRA
jgi:hypothetical protein